MQKLPSIAELKNLAGKKVFVRVDFNVSLGKDFKVTDDTRITEALPTIQYLIEQKAKIILLSHLGRPRGKPHPDFSFAHVLPRIEKHIGRKVHFIEKYWDPQYLSRMLKKLKNGEVAMCENTRFHPGELYNDTSLAKVMAEFADVFVLDAFGSAHRTHVSTVGLATLKPSYAGFLLEKEVKLLSEALESPKRPFLVIIGGAKTVEKIRVVESVLDIADMIYLGGAVANTFFATWGIGVGVSRVDHEMIEMARAVFWKATRSKCRLMLPSDVVVSNIERTTEPFAVPYDKVPGGLGIFDIGPEAQKEVTTLINDARTIIWNGPLGMHEDRRFKTGTDQVLMALSQRKPHLSIIGGGDTMATIGNKKLTKNITHVSTGGASMLEFLEKKTLPAIEVLSNSQGKR